MLSYGFIPLYWNRVLISIGICRKEFCNIINKIKRLFNFAWVCQIKMLASVDKRTHGFPGPERPPDFVILVGWHLSRTIIQRKEGRCVLRAWDPCQLTLKRSRKRVYLQRRACCEYAAAERPDAHMRTGSSFSYKGRRDLLHRFW